MRVRAALAEMWDRWDEWDEWDEWDWWDWWASCIDHIVILYCFCIGGKGLGRGIFL